MNVFTRCGVCGKEGTPEQMMGSGHPQMNVYAAPSWRLPSGWNDVLGVNLCGDCCARVRAVIHEMAQPPAKP